jgi:hypothetical protein
MKPQYSSIKYFSVKVNFNTEKEVFHFGRKYYKIQFGHTDLIQKPRFRNVCCMKCIYDDT